jgi:hypothetical protein
LGSFDFSRFVRLFAFAALAGRQAFLPNELTSGQACPAAPNLKSQKWLRALNRDPITLNRITVEILGWSMIFSESRLPLFGSCSRVLNGLIARSARAQGRGACRTPDERRMRYGFKAPTALV